MTLKTLLVSFALTLSAGFASGWLAAKGRPISTPLPLLPKEVIVERVVTKIVKVPVDVPGKAVEVLRIVTVEKPIVKEVLKVVSQFENPIGRVRLDAVKFQGLRDGKQAFGWAGNGFCEVHPGTDPDKWTTLFSSPFDLSASTAEITKDVLPETAASQKRLRLDLGVGAAAYALVWKAGVAIRLKHRNRFTSILAPDAFGAEIVSVGSKPAILVTAGKEF